jgi:hypothetical protein
MEHILCIYDFDSTLVKTPDENKGAHVHPDYAMIDEWWNSFASLDQNYFYFPIIPEIVEDFKKHKKHNRVLVTKRHEDLLPRVKQIVHSKGLEFDDYIATSHESKVPYVKELIDKFSPSYLRLLDDSQNNIEECCEFCKKIKIHSEVIFVNHEQNKIFVAEF